MCSSFTQQSECGHWAKAGRCLCSIMSLRNPSFSVLLLCRPLGCPLSPWRSPTPPNHSTCQPRESWKERAGPAIYVLKKIMWALASVAQLAGVSSHKQEGHWFNPWSGYMPKLQVPFWSGCIREAVDQCFSLTSLVFSFSFSLPSPLSKSNEKCPWVSIKNNNNLEIACTTSSHILLAKLVIWIVSCKGVHAVRSAGVDYVPG